ncbi:hypothetical protein [Symbiobacterium terraclitae]|uniref:hypothetical protein n=1 Tax=Symbiobacterium terraclitae TaxID=557451 RepID=UPI0035B560C4
MAINALQLFAEARNTYGFTGTLADVQAALAAVDSTVLEQAERARYRIEIWDEVSPLAGQPPEYWRQRGDWPEGGKVYLIYVDDNLRIVQPHDPEQAGFVPMDEAAALARAQTYVSHLVEQAVDEKVKEQVLINLLTQ